jgi:hypothetical protein
MVRGLPLAITSSLMAWRSRLAFREVWVNEVREVLRCWVDGAGLRTAAERAGVDRKTARRYVAAAFSCHGAAWETLLAHEQQISEWMKADLQLTNIHGKLTRRGVVVPYRTLHRFAVERCGFGHRRSTVRVADGKPGVECQLDFGRMGLIPDPGAGRRRVAHALIFTAVYSRHMFVWLSFRQTLETVIAGCEAVWVFFGGIFRVLIPDNLSPVVTSADAVNPTFSVGWLDYRSGARRIPRRPRVVRRTRTGSVPLGACGACPTGRPSCRRVAGIRRA